MSFVANQLNESEKSEWFIRMEPRLLARPSKGVTWSVYSGNIWVADWTYGYIFTEISTYGSQNLAASIGDLNSNGEYFYDHANQKVYIYDTFNPNTVSTWVFVFELYFSTVELYAPRILNAPETDSNPIVYWKPYILNDLTISQNGNDAMFGFIPSEATNFDIQFADSELQGLLRNAIFFKAKCRISQCLGDVNDGSNFRGVSSAFVSSYTLDDNVIRFAVESIYSVFDQNYDSLRFSTDDFPNLDPRAEDEGWLIRAVYGLKRGFVPVNIDYSDTPATNNNRDWVVTQGQGAEATYTWDIELADSDTDTTAIDISQNGGNLISVGDFIRLTDVNQTVEVISFTGPGDFKVEHAAVGARGAGTVVRPFISQVVIIDRDGVVHKLKYIDHWTTANFAAGTKGFVLNDNFEASIAGFPSPFDPAQDQIYVNVYGETQLPYLPTVAQDLGTVGRYGGSVDHPVAVIYDVLYSEREPRGGIFFDEQGFLDALNAMPGASVGFAIPENHTDSDPTLAEIVENICKSWFLRVHDSNYNGFAAMTVTEFVSVQATNPDFELDDSEISDVSFEFSSKDFASVFQVNFNDAEIYEPVNEFQFFKRENYVSTDVQYQFNTVKRFIVNTVLSNSDDAQDIVEKFTSILASERFRISFFTQYKMQSAKIGDVVEISREKIPGVDFVEGALNTVKGSIISLQRSSNGVNVTIEVY